MKLNPSSVTSTPICLKDIVIRKTQSLGSHCSTADTLKLCRPIIIIRVVVVVIVVVVMTYELPRQFTT